MIRNWLSNLKKGRISVKESDRPAIEATTPVDAKQDASPELTAEQQAHQVMRESANRRIMECKAAIDRCLLQFNCGIQPVVQIAGNQLVSDVQIFAKN